MCICHRSWESSKRGPQATLRSPLDLRCCSTGDSIKSEGNFALIISLKRFQHWTVTSFSAACFPLLQLNSVPVVEEKRIHDIFLPTNNNDHENSWFEGALKFTRCRKSTHTQFWKQNLGMDSSHFSQSTVNGVLHTHTINSEYQIQTDCENSWGVIHLCKVCYQCSIFPRSLTVCVKYLSFQSLCMTSVLFQMFRGDMVSWSAVAILTSRCFHPRKQTHSDYIIFKTEPGLLTAYFLLHIRKITSHWWLIRDGVYIVFGGGLKTDAPTQVG